MDISFAFCKTTFVLFLTSVAALGQQPINLSFENYDDESQLPSSWYVIEKQDCGFAYDTTKSMQGNASLKVYPSTKSPCSFLILNTLDKERFVNRQLVRITGYAQFRRRSREVSIVGRQMSDDGKEVPTSTTYEKYTKSHGWTKLSIQQKISPATEYFAFGLKGTIRDTIRFDFFQITIDGREVKDSKAEVRPPNTNEVNWLNEHIIPIDLAHPLEPIAAKRLMDVFGNYRVLGLGEVTHGSREVYEVKRYLTHFLMTQADFSLLVMEMDSGEAELINNYLLTGEGDPMKLLLSTSYWIWQTSEFLELLKSMRDYNSTSERKILIAGIDIPISDVTLESVQRFGQQFDAKVLSFADSIHLGFARLRVKSGGEDSLISKIASLDRYILTHKNLLVHRSSDRQFSFLRQSIVTLKQAVARLSNKMSLHFRDSCMAANMDWLLNYYPGSKVILWAHNEHIMKGGQSAGDFIAGRYSMFSVGFALGYGLALGRLEGLDTRVAPRQLHPAVRDSYESYFMMTKPPIWFLNFNSGESRKGKHQWLNDEHKFRFCGSVIADSYQFAYTNLTKLYDGIVFIRVSSASNLLKKP